MIKKVLAMQWLHTFECIQKFRLDSFISREGWLFTDRKMVLPKNISTNITPWDVWVILDSVESDHKDDLADVMKGSDIEFIVEDNANKHEDQS